MTTVALHRIDRLRRPSAFETIGLLLRAWRERSRGRAQLAQLSDYELHDIGLSRTDAWFESNKPFWRA